MTRTLIATLVLGSLAAPVGAGSAGPAVMPLFVVADDAQGHDQAYLLACAKPAKKGKGRFISGAACAKLLERKQAS